MKLEDIQKEWSKDMKIDDTELGLESLKIPQIHNKYYMMMSQERLKLKKYENDFKELKLLKYEYYNGTIDEETLHDMGWEPNPLKILRNEIPNYLEADKDLNNLILKIAYIKEKIQYLESIIYSINQRNWIIKNTIEWERFKTGGF